MLYCHEIDSPVGALLLVGDKTHLKRICFQSDRPCVRERTWVHDAGRFEHATAQLQAYFRGRLQRFALQLAPEGTPFQLAVWRQLREIPYGETISYGELARRIGNPRACRAVGLANGANPLPIVVPCHRVIGADGSLTGFGGGLPIKQQLLELERDVYRAALQSSIDGSERPGESRPQAS
jgi:methylated-DNA-[protein]-cysteine S-methyltransferase